MVEEVWMYITFIIQVVIDSAPNYTSKAGVVWST